MLEVGTRWIVASQNSHYEDHFPLCMFNVSLAQPLFLTSILNYTKKSSTKCLGIWVWGNAKFILVHSIAVACNNKKMHVLNLLPFTDVFQLILISPSSQGTYRIITFLFEKTECLLEEKDQAKCHTWIVIKIFVLMSFEVCLLSFGFVIFYREIGLKAENKIKFKNGERKECGDRYLHLSLTI